MALGLTAGAGAMDSDPARSSPSAGAADADAFAVMTARRLRASSRSAGLPMDVVAEDPRRIIVRKPQQP
ncbi:MAG: hypothetical protein MZW92_67760 [Comamonadaceae bacterium]|nr:hypothetical protein [Comamonadaceae bacterium]